MTRAKPKEKYLRIAWAVYDKKWKYLRMTTMSSTRQEARENRETRNEIVVKLYVKESEL